MYRKIDDNTYEKLEVVETIKLSQIKEEIKDIESNIKEIPTDKEYTGEDKVFQDFTSKYNEDLRNKRAVLDTELGQRKDLVKELEGLDEQIKLFEAY